MAVSKRERYKGGCYDCGKSTTPGFKSCAVCREKRRQYALIDPNHTTQTQAWQRRNYQRHRDNYNRWQALQWRTNPTYVLTGLLRRRLARVLKRKRIDAIARAVELLSCTPAQLKAHLEAQFVIGMGWENRDQWHIDHIRPVASFDLTDPKHQKECFHYTNLCPLWKEENQRKGAKWGNGYAEAAA